MTQEEKDRVDSLLADLDQLPEITEDEDVDVRYKHAYIAWKSGDLNTHFTLSQNCFICSIYIIVKSLNCVQSLLLIKIFNLVLSFFLYYYCEFYRCKKKFSQWNFVWL